jgi:hypothetical protein
VKSRITIKSYSKRAKWVVYPTVVLAMAIFLAFTIYSSYLGGAALNGYVTAGHYFVCEHGHCVEVSSSAWQLSSWLGYAWFAAFVLMFAEVALFINLGDIDWK